MQTISCQAKEPTNGKIKTKKTGQKSIISWLFQYYRNFPRFLDIIKIYKQDLYWNGKTETFQEQRKTYLWNERYTIHNFLYFDHIFIYGCRGVWRQYIQDSWWFTTGMDWRFKIAGNINVVLNYFKAGNCVIKITTKKH